MSKIVLDSSAVLALLRGEPGADIVEQSIDTAAMSAVNLQEVAKELVRDGIDYADVRDIVNGLSLEILAHDQDAAFRAAELFPLTRQYGSGLGDRSCMALALHLGVPVLTTDREWTKIKLDGLDLRFAR